jgi:response regulator RpfG family c-di-GMP phosphodiesterase
VEPKRVLVVGADQADDLMDCLRNAQCMVMNARDGEAALNFAKHEMVDTFVLVSTGHTMGRTETALNLHDIRPSSSIILISRYRDRPTPGEAIAKEIPNTQVLSRQELRNFFTPADV